MDIKKNFVFLKLVFNVLINGNICMASPTPPPELYKSTRLIILKIIHIIDLIN